MKILWRHPWLIVVGLAILFALAYMSGYAAG